MRFGSPKIKEKNSPSLLKIPSPDPSDSDDSVPPELVPIVTLLLAQAHRRYHEGIFMLYYDLNGDGKPGDREWKEVYGILTGTQLAYWDAASLAKFKNSPDQLLETSSKPNYLNFSDAMFNAIKTLPAAKQLLENVIIVSTTLKNRFIAQFRSYDALTEWYLALRLSVFEYNALQEAYTGALLSARGSRLSDIRTILAEKRFNHMEWVKIRYGSGMAWKRCYAVIEPSLSRRGKFSPGRVLLYENDKMKKQHLFGVIVSATSLAAMYPQSHVLIDKSTIMKLDGSVNFALPSTKRSKASLGSEETSLFLMPESHSAVAGYDTLIRFMIPLFDAFGLYGRPKRLKADRVDPDSLLFGLPTLPRIHYLMIEDLMPFAANDAYLSWDARTWNENLKRVLKLKLSQGYNGCGSSRGMVGALSSMTPKASPTENFSSQNKLEAQKRTPSGPIPPLSDPSMRPNDNFTSRPEDSQRNASQSSLPRTGQQATARVDPGALRNPPPQKSPRKNVQHLALDTNPAKPHMSVQLSDIYHKYSTIESPSDRFNDRNQILNGSAEDFEEEKIPPLMRKKSLMNGAYPTSDRHLLGSDDESDPDEEDDESLTDELNEMAAPSSSLQVPGTGHRNSSTSLVQSPGAQYDEFNKQFSRAADMPMNRARSNLSATAKNINFDSEEESSDEDMPLQQQQQQQQQQPPLPPVHQQRGIPNTLNMPQLQQLSLQQQASGKSPAYDYSKQAHQPVARPANIQKSRPTHNLTLELHDNRPKHIMSPNHSQNARSNDQVGNGIRSNSGADPASGTTAPTTAYRVPPPPQPIQPMNYPPQQQYPPQQHQYQPRPGYAPGHPGYTGGHAAYSTGGLGVPPSVSQPRMAPGMNPGMAPGMGPGTPGMAQPRMPRQQRPQGPGQPGMAGPLGTGPGQMQSMGQKPAHQSPMYGGGPPMQQGNATRQGQATMRSYGDANQAYQYQPQPVMYGRNGQGPQQGMPSSQNANSGRVRANPPPQAYHRQY